MIIDVTCQTENYHAVADALRTHGILKLNYGAEVGVRHGTFSEFLLTVYPKLRMLLVDPYLPYTDLDYEYTDTEQTSIFFDAEKRLLPFKRRTEWLIETSLAAAQLVEYPLDFVFIDAEHTYDSVKADIAVWVPHIRPGGMLSGHDFNMKAVGKAVTEYAAAANKDIYHVKEPWIDVWYILLD